MFDFVGALAGGIFGLATLVLVIAAIVSIVNSRGYTTGIKALWVLAVIAFPVLGSLVWFIFGRTSRA